jgi:hypothetical protein
MVRAGLRGRQDSGAHRHHRMLNVDRGRPAALQSFASARRILAGQRCAGLALDIRGPSCRFRRGLTLQAPTILFHSRTAT